MFDIVPRKFRKPDHERHSALDAESLLIRFFRIFACEIADKARNDVNRPILFSVNILDTLTHKKNIFCLA